MLLTQGPNFAAYLLSFSMLGTFWLAQHTLLGILGRCDRTLSWINLGFLFVVSLLPFSAALLAHYVHLRLAVGVYWLNLLLLGVGLEAAARYGRVALMPGDDRQALSRLATFRRRILLAQGLYALAALICLINTVASVIALGVVQLYYIVSPRLPRISSQTDKRAARLPGLGRLPAQAARPAPAWPRGWWHERPCAVTLCRRKGDLLVRRRRLGRHCR